MESITTIQKTHKTSSFCIVDTKKLEKMNIILYNEYNTDGRSGHI